MCNYKKNTIGHNEFIEIVKHIAWYNAFDINLRQNKDNIICNFVSGSYNEYKYSAKDRKKDFELTEDEFYEITNDNCYICGKQNSYMVNENDEIEFVHCNGVDRVNNEIGYIVNNCKTCCWTCNIMKNEYDYIQFINKLQQIYNNLCLIVQNLNSSSVNKQINKLMQNKVMNNITKNSEPSKPLTKTDNQISKHKIAQQNYDHKQRVLLGEEKFKKLQNEIRKS
jgi:hypothetical protein